MPSLLAFDTATEHLSVALQVGGRVCSHGGVGGAQASATLLPTIRRLLAEAGVGLRQLDAIAFGRGPGAFTGLRTACSVAQGLAFGADLPVLPVDTLLAVAEDVRQGARRGGGRPAPGDVGAPRRAGLPEDADADDAVWDSQRSLWVVMDARMDEIYAAHYAFDAAAGWQTRLAPLLTTPDALNQRWRAAPPQAVAGSAIAAFGDRLHWGGPAQQAADMRRADDRPRLAAPQRFATALPTARALLPLAEALWARGGAVDAAQALPLYLRDKVAQTTAERQSRATPVAPAASRGRAGPPLPP